jgi:hypothetical protein
MITIIPAIRALTDGWNFPDPRHNSKLHRLMKIQKQHAKHEWDRQSNNVYDILFKSPQSTYIVITETGPIWKQYYILPLWSLDR